MKKIGEYRRLFGVQKSAELKELKTIYRNLIKEWHPDKFHDNHDLKLEAEQKSTQIIEAYHFLVSIAPETIAAAMPEYTQTTNASTIVDFNFKDQILQINFLNGSAYEYFGVPKDLYVKFVNAPSAGRFARRHIYHAFTFRKTSNVEDAVRA